MATANPYEDALRQRLEASKQKGTTLQNAKPTLKARAEDEFAKLKAAGAVGYSKYSQG